jgi:sugar phosphate isomerase/epimerase
MLKTGMLSVTFRDREAREIVDLAAATGLQGIEWGGDVHVLPGDTTCATEVARLTTNAGLSVAAYGSYYRIGASEAQGMAFDAVLATAQALCAPLIRVWAGEKGSADADDAYRALVVEDALRIADLAAAAGMEIAYEWHGNTLTDTLDSALALLDATDRANVHTLWQATINRAPDDCLAELESIDGRLANIHVQHFTSDPPVFRALEEGADTWQRYLAYVASVPGDRYAMIEFVRDSSVDAFNEDAAVLRRIVASV